MENNFKLRQTVMNAEMRDFLSIDKGMVFADKDLECVHILSFDGYRWYDEFAMFCECKSYKNGGTYLHAWDDDRDELENFIKPNKLYPYIKLLHKLGYKQYVLKSGPTAVEEELENEGYTIQTQVKLKQPPRTAAMKKNLSKFEVEFCRIDDYGEHYEYEELWAEDEEDAVKVLRYGLEDEYGYANFVVEGITKIEDNPWKF